MPSHSANAADRRTRLSRTLCALVAIFPIASPSRWVRAQAPDTIRVGSPGFTAATMPLTNDTAASAERLQAQGVAEVEASALYVRAFGGAGGGFALGASREIPPSPSRLAHAIGADVWLAWPQVASGPLMGTRRNLAGVGAKWRAQVRPFDAGVFLQFSILAQMVMSEIPDRVVPVATTATRADAASPHTVHRAWDPAPGLALAAVFCVTRGLAVTVRGAVLHQTLFSEERAPFILSGVGLAFVGDSSPTRRC